VFLETTGGAVFSLAIFMVVIVLFRGEKKALEIFLPQTYFIIKLI
jgi:hypothetical protein